MNKTSYLLVFVFSSFLRGFEMSSIVLQKEQRCVWSWFVPEISSFFGQYLLLCQQIIIPEGINLQFDTYKSFCEVRKLFLCITS